MSNSNHSAATKNLLEASLRPASVVLDFDLSRADLGVPIVLDIDLDALEAAAAAAAVAPGWLPGDELHQQAYELVKAGGIAWREACSRVGVDYSKAQHRYRLRGLPSPVRTFPVPTFGTREETAAAVYGLILHGTPVSDAAPRHGISRQYFWSWCKLNRLPNPTAALRNAKASIAVFSAKA